MTTRPWQIFKFNLLRLKNPPLHFEQQFTEKIVFLLGFDLNTDQAWVTRVKFQMTQPSPAYNDPARPDLPLALIMLTITPSPARPTP